MRFCSSCGSEINDKQAVCLACGVAIIGDPWFQGETGDYWGDRMAFLRDQDNAAHVVASKRIGWNK